ncbi:CaiB/BaiF CoA transferase family protein [Streptomyces sp. NPDC102360]|uniref:CaiB/BaiF CoA transferase family protein n=1 Tax=Streptomyces sp. NPDC102360 TaxID=3366160 RepID=UPI003807865C
MSEGGFLMAGPLTGIRVVEVGGIGPGPFAGMLLADLGAEVVRVDRPTMGKDLGSHQILLRGRRSITLDLKQERGRGLLADLLSTSDALIEGFRPGVMERLGLGPDVLLARNPRLVYGRMTGWGQDGPLAMTAGHDINYIAVAGALEPLAGPDLAPKPPLNMLGDFGGGGMLLACGVLAALLHARETGAGQVVDAAVIDGTALLTSMLHSMRAGGDWQAPRGENRLDGGAPYYGVYRTADGGWLAVGAIEPQFYAQLLDGLGLTGELREVAQNDHSAWPRVRARFAERIAERTRDEWAGVFAGTDACVSPAVAPDEVKDHAHIDARGTFIDDGGMLQPAPAPRFGGTPLTVPGPAPVPGADTRCLLRELGLTDGVIDELVAARTAGPPGTATRKE